MAINMRKPVEAKAEAFIANASHSQPAGHSPEEASKAVVNIRFDAALLGRVDAAARRLGISRTAWLHVAASSMLSREVRTDPPRISRTGSPGRSAAFARTGRRGGS
jgi:hypothetical protein